MGSGDGRDTLRGMFSKTNHVTAPLPRPPMPPRPAQKRALLIGINAYPNLSAFAQLEGCVNDVRLMAGLLRDKFGFPDENVTVLTDAEATRDGILAALDGLAGRVGADDVVVVHYAGHGSQVTDVDGDEPDGLDETIVPYDGVRGEGANVDVTDDEIHDWIGRVTAKTPYLTLLFDCCHSGTITRDDFGAKARSLRPDLRPAPEIGRAPAPSTTRSASRSEGPSGWLPLSKRYVLVAGCRDEECSYEYRDAESDTPHGSLTFFLGRALAAAPPGTTYRDVYERVRPLVTAHSSKQHPQMEGALDRELFGVRDVEPMRFAPVHVREGGAVTLAAGAAHGLTAGSTWDVYPAGTKTTDGVEPLGRVRVTDVGAVASSAEMVDEVEGGAVAVGGRAVEAEHDWSGLVLRVAVRAPDGAGDALAAVVDGSGLLRRAEAGEPADLAAVLVPARAGAGPGDPVPQLGAVAEPTWAVVGADGRLAMPPRPASEPASSSTLRDNLNKLARFRHALALDNPDSRLRDAVDVTLKRLDGNGAWVEAEAEEAGGEVVFEEGERVAFTVANRHTAPVYVYGLDFGLTGAISLFTVAGANDALAPGREQSVGVDRPLVLRFPKAFPFVEEPGEAVPTEGAETLRVFVTTEPTDFASLLQEGVRSAGAGRSSLSRILGKAFHGTPTRDMSFADEPDDDADWTVVTRSFVVRRTAGGAALDATGGSVTLGAVTVRTRGLDGHARVLPSADFSARTRSVERVSDTFEAVLAREHVATQQTVEIAGARTRALGAEPQIEVEVPAAEGQGQALLYTDESGVTTWQFAEDVRPGAAATRSVDGTRRFVVGRPAPAPTGEVGTRGLVGAVGKKLLKLLVFPLVDPIIGAVSAGFAARWENVHRPYGLRPFAPDGFGAPAAAPLGPDDWPRLGAGRSLLFVHGTFSRAHSAFGGLAPETVAELWRRYEGRVFAFDHPTLSVDPRRNVEWLVERLPDDAALDVDVVCHSRGGLVGRVLAEQQGTLSLGARALRVGSVTFVATPNAGTPLADPAYLGDLVDTYTNLLNFVPDNPVTDVLEGVVTVAKQLAVGALGGLDGLQSMRPDGDFQRWLNAEGPPGETAYYALGADFTPREPGFRAWAKDRLMDAVFEKAENDLVVPTAGVYDANGSGSFPIDERRVFPASAGVSHVSFFQDPAAQEALLDWLPG